MIFKRFFTVLSLVAIAVGASAQKNFYDEFKPTNKWAVGLDLGPTLLHGDHQYKNFFGDASIGFAFGAKAKYMFSNTIGLQGNFHLGTLKAESTGLRTFSSTNNFFAFQMLPTFTLGNISWSRKMQPIHVNMFTGFGFIKNNVDATIDFNNGGTRNPDGTYNYKNTTTDFTLPIGAELRYNVSKRIDATLTYSLNLTNTDHMDGYPQNGNERIESYTTFLAGVMFKLGKDDEHMEWIAPVEKSLEQVDKNSEMITKLTGDKDGDGVSDFFDKDSEKKEGVLVYGNGVEIDSDGDGIADSEDAEPFSEKGASVDENGKMIDK
ncbi:MAG: outer membrane beta-barrel protein, partial [Bacteroidota bacterium]|nr:outer membrane beta-barrel protein [Bacteroidota bacterium]